MNDIDIKQEVFSFWNDAACGTYAASSSRFSKQYFEEIEEFRYRIEPEIFSFAQFTRHRDQKILEVGIGAGTDFLQWVRAGTKAFGIDLTEEAVQHVKHRLQVYGLSAEEVKVADAENLPYPDDFFDLIYSWGVIHHSPDTIRALAEIIRCTKPGGHIKLMLYNRRSLMALYRYLQYGLFQGKPFRKVSEILYHHQESKGTKAYTFSEINSIMDQYSVEIKHLNAQVTSYDLLRNKSFVFRLLAYSLACLWGFHRCGWFITIELQKQI